jgi:hypothetical protein
MLVFSKGGPMKNMFAASIILLVSIGLVPAAERTVVCEEMYADW